MQSSPPRPAPVSSLRTAGPFILVVCLAIAVAGGSEIARIAGAPVDGPLVQWSVELSPLPIRGEQYHVVTASIANHGRGPVEDLILDFRMRRDRDARINNVVRDGFFKSFALASDSLQAGKLHEVVVVEAKTFHVRCRIPRIEPKASGRLEVVVSGKVPHLVGEPILALASEPTQALRFDRPESVRKLSDAVLALCLLVITFTVGLAFGVLPRRGRSPELVELERRLTLLENRPA